MNRKVENLPIVGVNVLIRNKEEDTVFCIKRGPNDKYFSGMYALPGGGINEGENLEIAAKREFVEETGYTLVSITEVKLMTSFSAGTILMVEGTLGEKIADEIDADISEVGWVSLPVFLSSLEEHHYPAQEIQKFRDYLTNN